MRLEASVGVNPGQNLKHANRSVWGVKERERKRGRELDASSLATATGPLAECKGTREEA
jgi:hypothetical protein